MKTNFLLESTKVNIFFLCCYTASEARSHIWTWRLSEHFVGHKSCIFMYFEIGLNIFNVSITNKV
jgi:hypothetical protein